MIKFRERKQTNTDTHHITNAEINLKIHEIVMNFYARRDVYARDVYDSMRNNGYYQDIFSYIKANINK